MKRTLTTKTPSTPPAAATDRNFVRYAGKNEIVQVGYNVDHEEDDDPEAPVYECPG